ncbi:MAG: hypothetical protein J5989_08900 [Alistipes sp.]|nr:hypothetical protein [Alistipes sp.]
MERVIRNILLMCACVCACACSESINDDEPEIQLSNISGVWQQTAFLCSDGYFVPVYGLDAIHYEFAQADNSGTQTYIQYTLNEQGNKDISKQGTWEYDPQTQSAHISEPRGWNLDIHFTFGEKNNATLEIQGRTPNSSSTVKVKRLTK